MFTKFFSNIKIDRRACSAFIMGSCVVAAICHHDSSSNEWNRMNQQAESQGWYVVGGNSNRK